MRGWSRWLAVCCTLMTFMVLAVNWWDHWIPMGIVRLRETAEDLNETVKKQAIVTEPPVVTEPPLVTEPLSSQARDLELLLDLEARRNTVFESEYTRNHFITYVNDGGFGNRFQSLEIAFLWAVLLNRTLIVEPFTVGHNNGEKVSYTIFLEEIVAWPVLDAQKSKVERGQKVKLPQVHPETCRLDVLKVHNKILTLSSVVAARTLTYDSYWGQWYAMFAEQYHTVIRRFLSKHIRFSRSLCHGPLFPTPYHTVHIRLGDRPGLSLVNCSAFGFQFVGEPSWIKKGMPPQAPERTAIEYGCVKRNSTTGEVKAIWSEDSVDDWQRSLSPPAPVYIATNRPKDPRIVNIKQKLTANGFDVLTFEAVDVSPVSNVTTVSDGSKVTNDPSRPRDGALVSVIEQCIALYSESFLPAATSSWDSVVILRRMDDTSGRADVAEAHVHFNLMKELHARNLEVILHKSGCWA